VVRKAKVYTPMAGPARLNEQTTKGMTNSPICVPTLLLVPRKHLRGHVNPVLAVLLLIAPVLSGGCGNRSGRAQPSIEFTKVPEAREGGVEAVTEIEGRVSGARSDEKIVVYARSDRWWVQPGPERPLTPIQQGQAWNTPTHYGWEYAALLVGPGFRPSETTDNLPVLGGPIRAIATVKGRPSPPPVIKTIHFSGYEWKLRTASSNRGGIAQLYDPANAWTDESGALHLRISKDSEKWHCAEINLTRNLGYGTYRFTVRDSSFLEPAAVLSMFTWDETSAEQNHREFGVEVGSWGDPATRNAHFIVQPYYVPANVASFNLPPGRVSFSVVWRPENLSFRAGRGDGNAKTKVITEHSFTSGIPTPGNESLHLNLYVFGTSRIPLKQPTEVVVEKFEYIP